MEQMTNEERQHRIDYEIIVDAYDDYEVNMGWYYHFADNLEFPISAVAKLKKRNGQYENVEVILVEVCSNEDSELMLGLALTMQGYVFPISLKDIISVDTSEENRDVLNDWLFWKRLKLL